ncbi:hypothetical protein BJV78DRAFT_712956 [Lactifluus subvellereus]|nr:hypothetical protein BJV78DRAFT_712956 [Lactifluus subvellereus]
MLVEQQGKATPSRQGKALARCDICGKQLARQSDMPRHKRLHDPEPERWMHWCPEPGCDYGSMQRSNLRNHVRKHTGQRLRCLDDPACSYSTFDKSALLRHRQRRHGYQTKSTAAKDRRLKITASSRKLDNLSPDKSSSSSLSEPATGCPCPCSRFSTSTSNNCRAEGAVIIDETDADADADADDRIREWLDDHVPTRAIEQPVGSIEQRSTEGHVISRFPVSFARTRLPYVSANGSPPGRTSGSIGMGNSKHCRHCTCNLNPPSNHPVLAPATRSNSPTSKTAARRPHRATRPHREAKEGVVYRRLSYRVKEFIFLATC